MVFMLTPLFSRSSNISSHLLTSLKRYLSIFLLIIGVCFIIIKLAWSQPYQPSEVIDPSIRFNKISNNDINIHYAYSGSLDKPGLIFIHGTPGGWAAFEGYLVNKTLQQHFLMVSVDRPGWGESQTKNKKLNGEFNHQARSITAIMAQHPNKKWIIVGHSLGASLAPNIALQAPNSVSGLLLLAGSLSPKLGNPRWYNYAAKTWLVSKMIGNKMTRSNREIMKLHKQLTQMSSEIKSTKLNVDVVIIQGMKDKLVSPKNPAYALKEWRDNFASIEVTKLAEAGHFLPWQESNQLVNAIITLANKSSAQ